MNLLWFIELSKEGSRNLLRHKLRSTLTLLGVMFGVGAVITMMAIGEGAQRTVLREIAGLGLNNIIIDSVQPPEASRSQQDNSKLHLFQYGLTERDVAQIRALFPNEPVLVAHLVKHKVYYRSMRIDSGVLGVPTDYFSMFRTEVLEGRLLTAINELNHDRVAVLTDRAANAMKVVGGPIGKQIRIGDQYFKVIGIVSMPTMKESGMVYVPYKTAKDLFGSSTIKQESGSLEFTKTEVGQIVIHLDDERLITSASAVVERSLKAHHASPDFALTVPMNLLMVKQRTQKILNLVLLVIAAISLLVGIGIMNIMLAIVTERIPEIGIRRALGASRRDILMQFLAETVVLSTIGGVVGCLAGVAAVPLVSQWTGWSGVFTPTAIVLSLVISWLVGVVFGLAPAIQASRMNPVDCLRYE